MDLKQADLTKQDITTIEKEFRKTVAQLDESDNGYETRITLEVDQSMFDDYKNTTKEYENMVFDAIQLRLDNKYDEFLGKVSAITALEKVIAEEKLGTILSWNLQMVKDNNDLNTETGNSAIMTMITVIVICVIISIILALYIARLIANPLNMMKDNAKYVVQSGDLTGVMEIKRKDEIGEIQGAMGAVIGNFRGLIKKIMIEIGQINTESQGLSEISDITANKTVELQSQTQTASSSSEQVSANVEVVSKSVDELAKAIKEIFINTTAATTLTRESEKKDSKQVRL